ncbi:MAG: MBL fold metallo-hydrolase, partial [Thermoleophilaceae bacterium]|nr:MBL fold metallo-hydrolase [Thermoleophilaceae bacterium]
MRVTWAGHSTTLIEIGDARLLTDPLLRNRVAHLRRQAQKVDIDIARRLTAVLISHSHLDHLDRASLKLIDNEVPVVAARGCGRLLRSLGFREVHEVQAGDVLPVGNITIETIHAEHHGLRHPFADKADTVGFVARGAHDADSVYFAGDTDLFPELAQLSGRVNWALLPVWGWGPTIGAGHFNPERAAEAVGMIRPKIAIPIHWGTFSPVIFKGAFSRPDPLPPLDFARLVAELDVGTEVRIL